ncbi:hypothetical protein PUNSTDRAFT_73409, partial [Punctularia strigosozonata HHB-11173 SS5]|uniref:uncharacterized protein n=1 Tax=Punctularia strigosozonata (strain HHB-11173) TaxID=741275 RepID=UPI000441872A
RHYYLQVVQHPQKAAEFGPSSLSRLPLAPPPVVQLIVRDNTGNPIDDEAEIPFLVAHLSIFSADGSRQLDTTPGPGGERLLYGNLVSSPHRLRDLQGKHGIFFLFPDVSVRERGSYQLGVTLMSVARSVHPRCYSPPLRFLGRRLGGRGGDRVPLHSARG